MKGISSLRSNRTPVFGFWRLVFLLITSLLLLVAALAGCKSQGALPTATFEQVANVPTIAPSQTATLPFSPTPTSTRIPIPSSTPILTSTHTPTSTPMPEPAWFVRSAEIPRFPKDIDIWEIAWETGQSLRIQSGFWSIEYQTLHIAQDGSLPLQGLSPIATPFHNADPLSLSYSPQGTYVIECQDEKGGLYYSLHLYRSVDDQLIAETNNVSTTCSWSIRWKEDESALAFVTENFEADKNEYLVNVYVWKTDGSAPYLIGKGSHLDGPPSWSPDGDQLVIQIQNPDPQSLEDECTFYILYPDGRPARLTGAQLHGLQSMPLQWLTKNIVRQFNTCCAGCGFNTYYDISTGEEIPELYWSNCDSDYFDTQRASLSPDQRWIAVDKTLPEYEFVDLSETSDFTYVLYDLQARQSYTLSIIPDHYFEFLGWSEDSRSFYLIHRLASDAVPTGSLPFGLLALDPHTRQFKAILPDVRYVVLSPDRRFVFGLIPSRDELEGRIYSISGTTLTDSFRFPMPRHPVTGNVLSNLAVKINLDLVNVAWSPDSSWVIIEYPEGRLLLVGIDGKIQPLGDHLGAAQILWSPSGDRIFVKAGDRAWIVFLGD